MGPVGFGLLTTAVAVGGIVGVVSYGRLERRFSLGDIMRTGLLMETATHLSLAVTTSSIVALGTMVVFGAHAFVWGTTSEVVRQRAVPDELLGRVTGVYRVAIVGGLVIGTPIGGLLARDYGITAPFWFGFIGSALLVAVLWRRFDDIVHAGETAPDRTLETLALGEDLAQLRGEGIGIAGLAVLATEEAAVVAREDHGGRAEALGDGDRAAGRHRAPGLDAGGHHDPGRGRPQRLEVGLEVRARDDVLAQEGVVAVAVVLGGHPEHRRIRRRLTGVVRAERTLVADGGDELRHAGTEPAALVRVMDRLGEPPSAPSRSGRIDASGGSCATSVRTCSGCFATRASAFTAPPLLAKRSTGPASSSAMIRCRSSACCSGVDGLAGSAFVLRSTPRGS